MFSCNKKAKDRQPSLEVEVIVWLSAMKQKQT